MPIFRRKPQSCQYEPVPCPNWNNKKIINNYEEGCKNLEKCNKCHGWKENEYHPLNYKIKSCTNGLKCAKGSLCPYFHSQKDRRYFF